jgi:hypothetical protein
MRRFGEFTEYDLRRAFRLEHPYNKRDGVRIYRAHYFDDWQTPVLFAASSKAEATKIARLHGKHFSGRKLRWVYYSHKIKDGVLKSQDGLLHFDNEINGER